MKFIKKKNVANIQIENLDDLWYLSQIIDQGDIVEGKTFRKIKIGISTERSSNIVKKPIYLKITVEKIEFSKTTNILRVSGPVLEGTEEVPKGSYHTFSLDQGTRFTLSKQEWLGYQIDKLNESANTKPPKILICVLDREESYFAKLNRYGFEILLELKGSVSKKNDSHSFSGNFYDQVIKHLEEYDKRYNLERIILASPIFFKDDLMKRLSVDSLKKKIILATCSSVSRNAINEVLKRDETKQALKQERISKEIKLVDKLLNEISKEGLAEYSLNAISKIVDTGAIDTLLVTDNLIFKLRDENKFDKLEKIMKTADKLKAKLHIISSEHEGGKKLDGLGGIGAILRYKI